MRIDKIANNAKYRKDQQLQNLTMFEDLRNFANYELFLNLIINKLIKF